MSGTQHARVRARRRVAAGVAGLAALAAVALVAAPSATAGTSAARPTDAVQRSLDGLVATGHFPGALAAVRGRDGRTREYTAGVGNLATGAPVPADGYVRVGSNTKMFVSTVVLQLVGEGRVSLDAPVETYLPGLIRGPGIDGRHITVRQVLQHTSGLPNYTEFMPPFRQLWHTYLDPRRLLDLALAHPAAFAPGTSWAYSNTNYVVAGLLIERVTGRPVGEEITGRIIDRLGLRHTYWPGLGDQTVRQPHPQGYETLEAGAAPADVTVMDPSWGWAAGQLIATPGDLDRFMAALLDGRLLAPAQLAQMRTTVPVGTQSGLPADWGYGLGLMRIPLSCGGVAWGHGGDIEGYETRNAATADGRAATVAVTGLPTTETVAYHVIGALDRALCAG